MKKKWLALRNWSIRNPYLTTDLGMGIMWVLFLVFIREIGLAWITLIWFLAVLRVPLIHSH